MKIKDLEQYKQFLGDLYDIAVAFNKIQPWYNDEKQDYYIGQTSIAPIYVDNERVFVWVNSKKHLCFGYTNSYKHSSCRIITVNPRNKADSLVYKEYGTTGLYGSKKQVIKESVRDINNKEIEKFYNDSLAKIDLIKFRDYIIENDKLNDGRCGYPFLDVDSDLPSKEETINLALTEGVIEVTSIGLGALTRDSLVKVDIEQNEN